MVQVNGGVIACIVGIGACGYHVKHAEQFNK
jgi:hypothetical protein